MTNENQPSGEYEPFSVMATVWNDFDTPDEMRTEMREVKLDAGQQWTETDIRDRFWIDHCYADEVALRWPDGSKAILNKAAAQRLVFPRAFLLEHRPLMRVTGLLPYAHLSYCTLWNTNAAEGAGKEIFVPMGPKHLTFSDADKQWDHEVKLDAAVTYALAWVSVKMTCPDFEPLSWLMPIGGKEISFNMAGAVRIPVMKRNG